MLAGGLLTAFAIGNASAASLSYSETVEVSDNKSSWDLSLFPGSAGYSGVNTGVLGDGTALDYRLFNSGDPFVNAGYADGGLGLVGNATPGDYNNSVGAETMTADVWTTSDPNSAPADFVGDEAPGGTAATMNHATGSIDISGHSEGILYFIHGSYSETSGVSLVMSGDGEADVVAEYTAPDPGNVNKFWVSNFNFSDASAYDTISWTYTNGDADSNPASRARLMGVIFCILEDIEPDGMPDSWETLHGLIVGVDDSAFDNDADGGPDGLTNLEEYLGADGMAGGGDSTDPQDSDTDDDTLTDGDEVNGTQNSFHVGHIHGDPPAGAPGAPTNPLDDDSDDDGLLDGQEVAGLDSHDVSHGFGATNPNDADTEGDTLNDGFEVANNLDPSDDTGDNGAAGDPDQDTLVNFDEMTVGTDPRDEDTDNDGYKDNVEDLFGSWDDVNATGTNPLDPDSDRDGLLDGQENPYLLVPNPPSQYVCDPNRFDTDGDGAADGPEIANGTDPNDPLDTPVDLGNYILTVIETNAEPEPVSGTHVHGVLYDEDVPMFTDRVFEHNGVDASGLPVELIGGDYVMPANDAKNNSAYTADVTLIATASFYILMDIRISPRAWMTDGAGLDFVDTGLVTGVDGVPQTGPGNGIQNQFKVYLANDTANGNTTVIAPGTYTFYEQNAGNSANMYCILATAPVIIPDDLKVISVGFNAGSFEVTVGNLGTAKTYNLVRGTDLASFPDVVDTIVNPSATDTFSDSNPPVGEAFYRVKEVVSP